MIIVHGDEKLLSACYDNCQYGTSNSFFLSVVLIHIVQLLHITMYMMIYVTIGQNFAVHVT